MRKLISIIPLSLFFISVFATLAIDAHAVTKQEKADRAWCKWYGDMAEVVMVGRQKGHPYSQAVSEARTISKESQSVIIGLIDEAWASPIVEGEALKLATALIFKNENHDWCLEYHGLGRKN